MAGPIHASRRSSHCRQGHGTHMNPAVGAPGMPHPSLGELCHLESSWRRIRGHMARTAAPCRSATPGRRVPRSLSTLVAAPLRVWWSLCRATMSSSQLSMAAAGRPRGGRRCRGAGLGWPGRTRWAAAGSTGLPTTAVSALLIWPVLTAAEGVGDTLVGGVGRAVDAVGVHLQRTTTLCPTRRATSVAGTPGVPALDQAADPALHRVGASLSSPASSWR
jgi:hypothetical protein